MNMFTVTKESIEYRIEKGAGIICFALSSDDLTTQQDIRDLLHTAISIPSFHELLGLTLRVRPIF